MKRRKKIWIACGALGLVVLLCVLALTYSPVPFQFLDGAAVEDVDINRSTSTGGYNTAVHYRVDGSFESVVAAAQSELSTTEGWTWLTSAGGKKIGQNASMRVGVMIVRQRDAPNGRPNVLVAVVKPTSVLDRVLELVRKG